MIRYVCISLCLLVVPARPLRAADCSITTGNSPEEILGCLDQLTPGDTATIESGTYNNFPFSCITAAGDADNWVTIRGASPGDRPVLDFGDFNFTDEAPEPVKDSSCRSLDGGPAGNVHWAVFTGVGRYIRYQDIVVTGAHNSGGANWAFIMHADAGPIELIHVKAEDNDGGFRSRATGTSESPEGVVTLSRVELANNASLAGPNHNIYNSAGSVVVEFSHIHGPDTGQNIHDRAIRSTYRYNLIEDPGSYMGDMMDNRENTEENWSTQEQTYIGNIFVNRSQPGNNAQVFAIVENEEQGFEQILHFYYNTFIGYGTNSGFFHIANVGLSDPENAQVHAYNNIFYNWAGTISRCDGGDGEVHAQYNSFSTQQTEGDCLSASNNIRDDRDPFVDSDGGDYHLAEDSFPIGAANPGLGRTPGLEYSQFPPGYRIRNSANDLGAFEFGTDAPPPDGGVDSGTDGGTDGGAESGTDGAVDSGTDSGTDGTDDVDCSCRVKGPHTTSPLGLICVVGLLALQRWRRKVKHSRH